MAEQTQDPATLSEQELLVGIYKAVSVIRTVVVLMFLAAIIGAIVLIATANTHNV